MTKESKKSKIKVYQPELWNLEISPDEGVEEEEPHQDQQPALLPPSPAREPMPDWFKSQLRPIKETLSIHEQKRLGLLKQKESQAVAQLQLDFTSPISPGMGTSKNTKPPQPELTEAERESTKAAMLRLQQLRRDRQQRLEEERKQAVIDRKQAEKERDLKKADW